jgi:hypothetical protein
MDEVTREMHLESEFFLQFRTKPVLPDAYPAWPEPAAL